MFLRARWPVLSAPVITAVIVGTGMLAPSPVRGECGGYIVYTDHERHAADQQPMSEHPGPVRCHGPNCSQVPPQAPMPESPLTFRVLTDDPLIASSGTSLAGTSSGAVPADFAVGEPVRRPADVYHPPR
jgi:hypothetical protein